MFVAIKNGRPQWHRLFPRHRHARRTGGGADPAHRPVAAGWSRHSDFCWKRYRSPATALAFFLLLAFFVAAFACPRRSAASRCASASPTSPAARKQHEGTIPLTGGVGMFAGFALAALTSGLIAGSTLVRRGGARPARDRRRRRRHAPISRRAPSCCCSWSLRFVHELVGGNICRHPRQPVRLRADQPLPVGDPVLRGVRAGGDQRHRTWSTASTAARAACPSSPRWRSPTPRWRRVWASQALLLLLLGAAVAGFLVWQHALPRRAQPGPRVHGGLRKHDTGSRFAGFRST